MSLSLAGLESGLKLGSTRLNAKWLMNANERPRATHIHREVHGALFVQTINNVAQGHDAQFTQISIVIIITIIIIIIIERLF